MRISEYNRSAPCESRRRRIARIDTRGPDRGAPPGRYTGLYPRVAISLHFGSLIKQKIRAYLGLPKTKSGMCTVCVKASTYCS